TNILQIVYLDVVPASSLRHFVSFMTNLYLDGRFESLQLVCCECQRVTSFINKFVIQEEEEFLLYNKQFEI
ncbi:MAG: hypothetical protein M3M91_00530, partial [Thermoproteota archaeon]|nr:hypothetical protein [Thermoproteota archaeon]